MNNRSVSTLYPAVRYVGLGLLLVSIAACSKQPAGTSAGGPSTDPAASMPMQGSHSAGDLDEVSDLNANVGNQTQPSDAEMASFDRQAEQDESSGARAGEAVAADYYTVAHYDTQADPAEQLQATLQRAESENKTVLLQVGGDWCIWCKRMTSFIAETPAVGELISQHYLIQKVTYDADNPNDTFLSQYPKINGYPHLFVLDAAGNVLHSQDTAELEEGQSYSQEAFVEFLNKWRPGQVN